MDDNNNEVDEELVNIEEDPVNNVDDEDYVAQDDDNGPPPAAEEAQDVAEENDAVNNNDAANNGNNQAFTLPMAEVTANPKAMVTGEGISVALDLAHPNTITLLLLGKRGNDLYPFVRGERARRGEPTLKQKRSRFVKRIIVSGGYLLFTAEGQTEGDSLRMYEEAEYDEACEKLIDLVRTTARWADFIRKIEALAAEENANGITRISDKMDEIGDLTSASTSLPSDNVDDDGSVDSGGGGGNGNAGAGNNLNIPRVEEQEQVPDEDWGGQDNGMFDELEAEPEDPQEDKSQNSEDGGNSTTSSQHSEEEDEDESEDGGDRFQSIDSEEEKAALQS